MQILVLAWAGNRKDLEVVWKTLSQVCLAYRADGGRVVVVLSSRDKLVSERRCTLLSHHSRLSVGADVTRYKGCCPRQPLCMCTAVVETARASSTAKAQLVDTAVRLHAGLRIFLHLLDHCCWVAFQEMEELFRRTIPEDSRYGTQFVFRQVRHASPEPGIRPARCAQAASPDYVVGFEKHSVAVCSAMRCSLFQLKGTRHND